MLYILLAFNLLAVLSVVFVERKKPEEALLWVAIISLIPFVGLLLYLILGSTLRIKAVYHLRTGNLRQEYRRILDERLSQVKAEKIKPLEAFSGLESQVIHFNTNYTKSMLTYRNKVDIYTSGAKKYQALFADLSEAKETIHIVYYGIHNDEIGWKLVDILAKKAQEGVTVRVLFDGLGSFLTPSSMFKPLMKAGGHVRRIKPLFTHYRNHRKIVVIDGHIGYTGGMNIGRKYVNANPRKRPWRDTQVRIQGEAVYSLQYYFLYDWLYANKANKSGITEDSVTPLFPENTIAEPLACQVIGSGVDTDQENMKMVYLRLITSARKRIVIQTPYFVPDETLLESLRIAAASGIEVVLMLPKQKSSFFLEPVTHYYIGRLIPYGAKVLLYDGYIHAKTITIDGDITAIGSVNMDVRSLTLDDEICVVFYGSSMDEAYGKVLDEDKAHCEEMDYIAFSNRGALQRVKERFFLLFAPLM